MTTATAKRTSAPLDHARKQWTSVTRASAATLPKMCFLVPLPSLTKRSGLYAPPSLLPSLSSQDTFLPIRGWEIAPLGDNDTEHPKSRPPSREEGGNVVRVIDARSVMKKRVVINGVSVKWEDVTREQALDRLKDLDKQARGVARSMAFVERYLRVLDETGCETAGEYARKLAAEAASPKPLKPAKRA